MSDLQPPFLPMPRLGLGTWPMRGEACEAAVASALRLGYRHVDTAEMYGNESEVGAGLRASGIERGAIFLTTKVWWDKPDGDSIRRATHASVGRLGTTPDLLLIHWPSPQLNLPDALRALARLRDEGVTRFVGVANFPANLLRRAVELELAPIACVQVEHHALLGQERLRAYATPRGIALTSYTPVAKGAFANEAALRTIAAAHDATPTQVALAYLLRMDGVAAIPKSESPERQRENLGAMQVTLTADEVATIDRLPKDRRMVDPSFAPDWND